MALHLKTAREARKYAFLQDEEGCCKVQTPAAKSKQNEAPKVAAKAPTFPAQKPDKEGVGIARGEVTHILKKSLEKIFDMTPIIGSSALCVFDGRLWQCVVYAEVGDRRFSLREETFREHFEEVTE